MIGGSGSGKTNALVNLIKQQDNDMLLIKFIYILRIQIKQNINIILKKKENCDLKG